MVEYYHQRSSDGGLIVSEATCVSVEAHGYPCTPTLYQPEALAAWRPVVEVGRGGAPAGLLACVLWAGGG
jgi:2,4-dienoyl-CoA reductase-like NADH-dependent reductase (Old Yellow Enzyme family)